MQGLDRSMFGSRSPRMSFFAGLFFYLVALYLIMIPVDDLFRSAVCTNAAVQISVIGAMLLVSIPFVRVAGRRLHDLGWAGWLALALPLAVTLRYEFVREGQSYYCDVGAIKPLSSMVSPLLPNALTELLASWPTFALTFNGTTVEMAMAAFPLMIYLAFFKGQSIENRYGQPQATSTIATNETRKEAAAHVGI